MSIPQPLWSAHLEGTTYQAIGDPIRVIAVVGAGASADVLDRGQALAQRVIGLAEQNPTGYRAELERISLVYGLKIDDFETQLMAMSRTSDGERRVRRTLSTVLNIRHPTLLGYELLAHFLKHRFLDAIITFNFDELLDQSLLDELGEREMKRVVSERDCIGVEFDPDQPSYIPVYLKLHGTASDPESLRFTRESYYSVPDRIAASLTQLLNTTNCIILNVGFGLVSFDFTGLLKTPARLRIYNVSHDALTHRAFTEISSSRESRMSFDEIRNLEIGRWRAPASYPFGGTDMALDHLADQLTRCAPEVSPLLVFRSVVRHRTVARLLADSVLTDTFRHRDYLRKRTELEFAFSNARSRGLASITALVEDRCSAYFSLYKRLWTRKQSDEENWQSVAERGGFRQTEVSNETFVAHADVCETAPIDERSLRPIDATKLASYVWNRGDAAGNLDRQKRQLNELAYALTILQNGTEVEIHSQDDNVCAKVFSAPSTLTTFTSLRARTLDLLHDRHNYNQLAVIAESGAWLLERPFREVIEKRIQTHQLKLLVIVAFDIVDDRLKSAFGDHVVIRQAPWWRHQRHLTVTCDSDQPLGAIYFARRMRSLFVTPVYLHQKTDLTILLRVFVRLWKEALLSHPLNPKDLAVPFSALWNEAAPQWPPRLFDISG